MQVKTILNRVHKIKGFVYGSIHFSEWNKKTVLEVEVLPRKGNRPICSGCGKKRPGYDKRDKRRFEMVPLWGITFFLIYTMRRVECPDCRPYCCVVKLAGVIQPVYPLYQN